MHNFLRPCSPWLASIAPSINLSSSSNISVSSFTNQSVIYVNTVQYQIILLHGCVKWLGHPFGCSSLLTIFGCVSNPFSAQPWSCGSSAWRHCVSVDPYGAEHREGGTQQPTVNIIHSLYKVRVAVGSGEWVGLGKWGKFWLTRNTVITLTVIPPVRLKQRQVALGFCMMSHLSLGWRGGGGG